MRRARAGTSVTRTPSFQPGGRSVGAATYCEKRSRTTPSASAITLITRSCRYIRGYKKPFISRSAFSIAAEKPTTGLGASRTSETDCGLSIVMRRPLSAITSSIIRVMSTRTSSCTRRGGSISPYCPSIVLNIFPINGTSAMSSSVKRSARSVCSGTRPSR